MIATEAIDRLHATAESHHRVMLIEVMGRDAAWIALHSGIAGGAHIILVPEILFSFEGVCDAVRARELRGKRFSLVVVAEGVKMPKTDPSGKIIPGGSGWSGERDCGLFARDVAQGRSALLCWSTCSEEVRQRRLTAYWGLDWELPRRTGLRQRNLVAWYT